MNDIELKKAFGNDYPAAVTFNGIRMPLAVESAFMRYYHTGESGAGGHTISRFMDGSASITAPELKAEWPKWNKEQRQDFCGASAWLHRHPDFPEILRFIMRHGSLEHWSELALSIASQLPSNEAFAFLCDSLRTIRIGQSANFTQAIAATKHPEAEATIRKHFEVLWRSQTIWNATEFCNPVAFDATACISHLIELGASPGDFDDHVRKLSHHVCSRNRQACRSFLSKYFSWL